MNTAVPEEPGADVASLKQQHRALAAERASLLAALAKRVNPSASPAPQPSSSAPSGLMQRSTVVYDADDVLRLRDCWKALQREPDAEKRRVIVREVEARLLMRIEEERSREQRLCQALRSLRVENERIRRVLEVQYTGLTKEATGEEVVGAAASLSLPPPSSAVGGDGRTPTEAPHPNRGSCVV